MSEAISLTDDFKAIELAELAQRGLALFPKEVEFLAEYLDRRELDILEALRPRRRRQ